MKRPEYRRPVNNAPVRNPKWSGADGEMAVVVGRGDPRRTNQQMLDAVARQVRNYMAFYSGRHVEEPIVDLAIKLIAKDSIDRPGSQGVFITREDLLKYIEVAKQS